MTVALGDSACGPMLGFASGFVALGFKRLVLGLLWAFQGPLPDISPSRWASVWF